VKAANRERGQREHRHIGTGLARCRWISLRGGAPSLGFAGSGAEQHANGRRDRRSWTWAALLRRALNSQRPAAGCGGPHRLVEGDRFGCTERSRCRSSGAGFVAKPDARASTNVRGEGLGSFRRARLPRKPTSRIVVRLRARPPPPLSTSGFRLTRTASQTKVPRHSAHTQFRTRFLEPESTPAITRREPVKRLRREKGRAHHATLLSLGSLTPPFTGFISADEGSLRASCLA
jgi:hypothetical protein